MKKLFIILITAFMLTGCTDPETEIQSAKEESVKEAVSHEYYCDKFLLTVDDNQLDLTIIEPNLSSVSELYPISEDHLYILGRIDENYNALMIYDFNAKEIIFSKQGTTMCWVQNKFETVRYLKDHVVYDLNDNIIYQPEESKLIEMIEYVVEDFKITITDADYTNPEEIWIK